MIGVLRRLAIFCAGGNKTAARAQSFPTPPAPPSRPVLVKPENSLRQHKLYLLNAWLKLFGQDSFGFCGKAREEG
jgi:hypothetical protein